MPTTCATVSGCSSTCSWRLGWLADAGIQLAAITYSFTTAEPPDTEYELAWVSRDGLLADLGRPNAPNHKRHQMINLNLRLRSVKREVHRPGKRLMQSLAKRIMRMRRNSRTFCMGAMKKRTAQKEENCHRTHRLNGMYTSCTMNVVTCQACQAQRSDFASQTNAKTNCHHGLASQI